MHVNIIVNTYQQTAILMVLIHQINLKNLDLDSITLLTNNPEKVKAVAESGITCVQKSLVIEPNEFNKKYLSTKAERLGHHVAHQSGGK